MSEFRHPMCGESIKAFLEWLEIDSKLMEVASEYWNLRNLIKKAEEELKKKYGEGFIARKRVGNNSFPIFRSLKRGKDYNLEKNYPELAQKVNEYFELKKRIEELTEQKKKLDQFLDMAVNICIPPDVRGYKRRKMGEDLSYVMTLAGALEMDCKDGYQEACTKLKELEECMKKGFKVWGKRIICE